MINHLDLISFLTVICQGVLLILLAPGVMGLLQYLKAEFLQLRRSPVTILHPYWDLFEMMKRPAIRSETSTWFFGMIPVLLLLVYGSLVFTIPIISSQVFLITDLIVVMYMLALGRFLLSLAGIDASAPFPWLGSSREMFYHFNTELVFVSFLVALAVRWDSTSLVTIIQNFAMQDPLSAKLNIVTVFIGLSLALNILLEAGRIPVDNPETHYELTMGKKGIELEFAGRDLALIEWSEMIKFIFLIALFVDMFVPIPLNPLPAEITSWSQSFVYLFLFLVKIIFFILVLAVWEVIQPKMRLRAVFQYSIIGIVFSLLAIIFEMTLPE
jgi:formate hydrogenlyase subunit 4